MFKNIILISFRNFRRQKIHTLVNLSGLSLGISAVLVIFLLLSFLTSYDRYHKNFDHIYRLVTQTDKSNGQEKDYTTGLPIVLPEAFKNDFPNVKAQAFISYKMSGIVTIDEQKEFEEGEGLAYSEAAFFEIFDRKLLKGNPEKVLTDPGKVVISEKFAKKYFNGDDPIGKTFTMLFEEPQVKLYCKYYYHFIHITLKLDVEEGEENPAKATEPVCVLFLKYLNPMIRV